MPISIIVVSTFCFEQSAYPATAGYRGNSVVNRGHFSSFVRSPHGHSAIDLDVDTAAFSWFLAARFLGGLAVRPSMSAQQY